MALELGLEEGQRPLKQGVGEAFQAEGTALAKVGTWETSYCRGLKAGVGTGDAGMWREVTCNVSEGPWGAAPGIAGGCGAKARDSREMGRRGWL